MSARILIVDDLACPCLDTRAALDRTDTQLVGSGSPAEAVTLARQLRPDLVIVDLDADAPSGIVATAGLWQHRLAPVLAVVSAPPPALLDLAASSGALGVLPRPFTDPLLTAGIRVALARWAEQQQSWHELQSAREALEARVMVDRAKLALIDRRQLREPEAHHLIQQLSMISRRSKRVIAEEILLALHEECRCGRAG